MVDNTSKWNELFDTLHEDFTKENQGHYSEFEEIGRGGSKIIYRASDNLSGREVAFARPLKNDSITTELFLREARITAYLQHPNILPAYDMCDDEEPYLVCKLLRGSNLAELCKQQQNQRDTLAIFRKICEAMNYAHSRGVLHLDLKPENIHLDKYGEVLVIDWGLAEIFLTESLESPLDNPLISTREVLSSDTTFCGTPGFMSPEQICNQNVDVRSDVFALGALLYSIFFNQSPFHAPDLKSICAKTQLGEIPNFDQGRMSSGLRSIMLKCLHAKKEDRYQNMRELLDDLDALQNNFIPSAEEANFVHHCKMLYKRNRQSCHFLLASFVLLVLTSLFYIHKIQESRADAVYAKGQAIQAKEQAEAYLQQVIEEQKQNEKLSIALSPRYLNIAKEHWEYYELDQSIEYCDLALRVNPNNLEAQEMRAKLYFAYGDYTQAKKIWERLNSSEQEQQFNRFILNKNNLHPDDIYNYRVNSSPIKILKARALFHSFRQSGNLEQLKQVIKIENPKVTELELSYDGDLFDVHGNSHFINNNFLRALKLKRVNLSETRIDNIDSLRHSSLKELNIAHAPIWDLSPLADCKIEKLDLSNSYIEGLWLLTNCELKELNINHTKVRTIPYQIFTTLELLSMNKTRITELPKHAPKLRILNITKNHIKNLPRLLSYPALEELFVDQGQLNTELTTALQDKGVKIHQLSSSSKR